MIGDLRARFLPRFVATAGPRLERARVLLAAREAGAAAAELHALAGEAGMLDLGPVADEARAAEIAARRGDVAGCGRHLETLAAAVARLASA